MNENANAGLRRVAFSVNELANSPCLRIFAKTRERTSLTLGLKASG